MPWVTNMTKGVVEYPDGAPPELVREMKESDDVAPGPRLKRGSEHMSKSASSGALKIARQQPLGQSGSNSGQEVVPPASAAAPVEEGRSERVESCNVLKFCGWAVDL